MIRVGRVAAFVAFAVLAAACAAQAPGASASAPAPGASAQLPLGRPLVGTVPVGGIVLRNPGFELPFPAGGRCPPGWGCSAHAGPDTFRFFYDESHPAQGRASGCIEPVAHEPWAKLVQGHGSIQALRGKRIRLSALVRLQDVAGGAGLVAIAQGGSGNNVASRKALQKGTTDWRPMQVELEVPPSAFVLELGLVLEGTGRACMDEVRLEVL
ncbi:MAG TPA: hypothetical protein VHP55_01130 [Usitatibacter sp.]|jgi:hypothetical protein|nr:hypothetical protein [Usitatibacter sp.]